MDSATPSSTSEALLRSKEIHDQFSAVKDLIAHQTLLTIEPHRTLDKALQMMMMQNIRHLPVVTKHTNELVGIISERDLRLASVSPIIDKEMSLDEAMKKLAEHEVSECMSTSLHTISDTDTILTACKLMRVSKRGALPVVNEESKKLVGIVTRLDLLDHLIRVLEPLHEEEQSKASTAV